MKLSALKNYQKNEALYPKIAKYKSKQPKMIFKIMQSPFESINKIITMVQNKAKYDESNHPFII